MVPTFDSRFHSIHGSTPKWEKNILRRRPHPPRQTSRTALALWGDARMSKGGAWRHLNVDGLASTHLGLAWPPEGQARAGQSSLGAPSEVPWSSLGGPLEVQWKSDWSGLDGRKGRYQCPPSGVEPRIHMETCVFSAKRNQCFIVVVSKNQYVLFDDDSQNLDICCFI